jgi:hypothetical protein
MINEPSNLVFRFQALARLRRENRKLKEEREILPKAAA